MKRLFLLLALLGLIFTACEKGLDDEDNGGAISKIELGEQSVEVEFESAEYEVPITSPCSWRAMSHDDWVVINTPKGIAGTKILKLSVARNEEMAIREGTVVVKNEDYNLVAELYVIQKAFVPEFKLDVSELYFPTEGGEQEVAIAANFNYEVTENADWLSVGKSEKGIEVTATASDVVEERTTEITISNEKYGAPKTIKIRQGAFIPELTISTESLHFESEGGKQEITITANFNYKVTENADWLSVGKSEKGIEVTATASDVLEERTTEITISNEKYGAPKIIKITQEGYVPAITVEPGSLLFTQEGGIREVAITANFEDFDYEVISEVAWLSIDKKGNSINVIAAAAEESVNRTAEITILNGKYNISKTIEVSQKKAETVERAIMVYFIGTNLRTYFNYNIKDMIEALDKNIQRNSRVVVITTDSATKATLYELRYDNTIGRAVKEKIKEISLSIPYDSNTFEDVIRNMKEFAPAKKYALVVGSNSLGWVPNNPTTGTSISTMSLGLSPEILWKRNPNAEMTRHIGDNLLTRYDITEIAAAIKTNNIKFDYILFDACFMSNIESVYELRDAAKYIIGSPCEIMGYGFPYAKIMPYMFVDNGSNYDIDKICYAYVDYYKNVAATKSACVAVTNTAELEALAATVKEVNKAAIKSDFALSDVQYYEGGSPHSFYDLGDLIEKSCTDATAVSNFKKQLDKTVTSRYHTTQFYSAYDNKLHDILYYSGITTSAMVEHYQTDW